MKEGRRDLRKAGEDDERERGGRGEAGYHLREEAGNWEGREGFLREFRKRVNRGKRGGFERREGGGRIQGWDGVGNEFGREGGRTV